MRVLPGNVTPGDEAPHALVVGEPVDQALPFEPLQDAVHGDAIETAYPACAFKDLLVAERAPRARQHGEHLNSWCRDACADGAQAFMGLKVRT